MDHQGLLRKTKFHLLQEIKHKIASAQNKTTKKQKQQQNKTKQKNEKKKHSINCMGKFKGLAYH